eukprot:2859699-Pleurochrysis_carterae.AAC.1
MEIACDERLAAALLARESELQSVHAEEVKRLRREAEVSSQQALTNAKSLLAAELATRYEREMSEIRQQADAAVAAAHSQREAAVNRAEAKMRTLQAAHRTALEQVTARCARDSRMTR